MTEIVRVNLPDGGTFFVEIPSMGGDAGVRDRLNLDEARSTLVRIGHWVKESVLAALPEKPDRLCVEYGVKLSVQSGKLAAVLASASAESAITVKMEWDVVK